MQLPLGDEPGSCKIRADRHVLHAAAGCCCLRTLHTLIVAPAQHQLADYAHSNRPLARSTSIASAMPKRSHNIPYAYVSSGRANGCIRAQARINIPHGSAGLSATAECYSIGAWISDVWHIKLYAELPAHLERDKIFGVRGRAVNFAKAGPPGGLWEACRRSRNPIRDLLDRQAAFAAIKAELQQQEPESDIWDSLVQHKLDAATKLALERAGNILPLFEGARNEDISALPPGASTGPVAAEPLPRDAAHHGAAGATDRGARATSPAAGSKRPAPDAADPAPAPRLKLQRLANPLAVQPGRGIRDSRAPQRAAAALGASAKVQRPVVKSAGRALLMPRGTAAADGAAGRGSVSQRASRSADQQQPVPTKLSSLAQPSNAESGLPHQGRAQQELPGAARNSSNWPPAWIADPALPGLVQVALQGHVAVCPALASLLHVPQDVASKLLQCQSYWCNMVGPGTVNLLQGCLVLVQLREGLRLRPVLRGKPGSGQQGSGGSGSDGAVQLGDGSWVPLTSLSNAGLGELSREQLHASLCEMAWQMQQGNIEPLLRRAALEAAHRLQKHDQVAQLLAAAANEEQRLPDVPLRQLMAAKAKLQRARSQIVRQLAAEVAPALEQQVQGLPAYGGALSITAAAFWEHHGRHTQPSSRQVPAGGAAKPKEEPGHEAPAATSPQVPAPASEAAAVQQAGRKAASTPRQMGVPAIPPPEPDAAQGEVPQKPRLKRLRPLVPQPEQARSGAVADSSGSAPFAGSKRGALDCQPPRQQKLRLDQDAAKPGTSRTVQAPDSPVMAAKVQEAQARTRLSSVVHTAAETEENKRRPVCAAEQVPDPATSTGSPKPEPGRSIPVAAASALMRRSQPCTYSPATPRVSHATAPPPTAPMAVQAAACGLQPAAQQALAPSCKGNAHTTTSPPAAATVAAPAPNASQQLLQRPPQAMPASQRTVPGGWRYRRPDSPEAGYEPWSEVVAVETVLSQVREAASFQDRWRRLSFLVCQALPCDWLMVQLVVAWLGSQWKEGPLGVCSATVEQCVERFCMYGPFAAQLAAVTADPAAFLVAVLPKLGPAGCITVAPEKTTGKLALRLNLHMLVRLGRQPQPRLQVMVHLVQQAAQQPLPPSRAKASSKPTVQGQQATSATPQSCAAGQPGSSSAGRPTNGWRASGSHQHSLEPFSAGRTEEKLMALMRQRRANPADWNKLLHILTTSLLPGQELGQRIWRAAAAHLAGIWSNAAPSGACSCPASAVHALLLASPALPELQHLGDADDVIAQHITHQVPGCIRVHYVGAEGMVVLKLDLHMMVRLAVESARQRSAAAQQQQG